MTAPIRTRTRRAPAVQPVSKPTITIDLLDQPTCSRRTDFDELERRLYLSSNPTHWAQAEMLKQATERTEERVIEAQEEEHGDVEVRNKERLALRALVRKLVAQLKAPLEITIRLDADGETDVVRTNQNEFDELLEEAAETINDYDVDVLEAEEKPKTPEKKNG